jgi:predicted O-methyltransferase YrrM
MLRRLIGRVPVVGGWYRRLRELEPLAGALWQPPGHFYSPITSREELAESDARIFDEGREPLGVSLNEAAQLELLARLAPHYRDQPFADAPSPRNRYHFDNPAFVACDALLWHALLRTVRPGRVIEVGSGYSSGVLLDTNEQFLEGTVACTFIEPYPELLYSLLKPQDASRVTVIPSRLQDVPLDTFAALQRDDVLFIDSSHVGKTGSDVNHALFEILPRLASGVYVHIHDVIYPFEYPRQWAYQGRSWNEAYLVQAFLMYNSAFDVVLWNSWLQRKHAGILAERFPRCARSAAEVREGAGATSLWLRKR